MKVLIGANADDAGRDALALGSLLCRALDAEPLLCHVHPADFQFPSQSAAEAEWANYLERQATEVLADAQQEMAETYGWDNVDSIIGTHHSSGKGLADVASAELADFVVIGTGPGARSGELHVGSTADKLLHGSPVPVALAPAGYRRDAPEKIGKVVVGFRDTPESKLALAKGGELADAAHAPLSTLTVLVRHRLRGGKFGGRTQDELLAEQQQRSVAAQEAALEALGVAEPQTEAVIADSARSALQRMQWDGDEVLILASAPGGPLKRVFLGDMTYKLLRSSPVPTIVLPRHQDVA